MKSIPGLHVCMQNIEYVRLRKRMMAMLSKLELGAENDQPFLNSWNASVDESTKTTTQGSSTADCEASLDTAHDDRIFSEEESITCFRGDTTLLRDMSLSTSQLLCEIIIPRLTKLLKSAQQEALFKCACDTVIFLLTLTECVIAPRLRRAAINARRVIFENVESLEEISEVSDEDFVRLARKYCASSVEDAPLVTATETLLQEASNFANAIYSHFDPNCLDGSSMSAKNGEVVCSRELA